MSPGEVEEKFNYVQLTIMSIIQEINHEDLKKRTGSGSKQGGNVLNKGGTPEERNAKAFKML